MVSPSDSLVYALTDICFGLFLLSLRSGRSRHFGTLAMLAICGLILLTQNGVYLNTGWHSLQDASRASIAAMIVLAMWRYVRKELAVDEEEEYRFEASRNRDVEAKTSRVE